MFKMNHTFSVVSWVVLSLFLYGSICSASHKNLHKNNPPILFDSMQSQMHNLPNTGAESSGHHGQKDHSTNADECCVSILTTGSNPNEIIWKLNSVLLPIVFVLSFVFLLIPSKLSFFSFREHLSPPNSLVDKKVCLIC
ncbi:MAG: hypothetical protein QNL04_07730 [SAR324 cluster bacterium]|nr:hypothetical protein [SAR324 cluster bacterium]